MGCDQWVGAGERLNVRSVSDAPAALTFPWRLVAVAGYLTALPRGGLGWCHLEEVERHGVAAVEVALSTSATPHPTDEVSKFRVCRCVWKRSFLCLVDTTPSQKHIH
jgi:hypothetical protein